MPQLDKFIISHLRLEHRKINSLLFQNWSLLFSMKTPVLES